MGNRGSKSSKQQLYPSNKPWRNLPETDTQLVAALMDDINQQDTSYKAKILLCGPVGAGKSSFINSCLSASLDRKNIIAGTGNDLSNGSSFTCVFQHYDDDTLLKSVQIADCMGICEKNGLGLNENDIVKLLNGNIKDGYTFNPKHPIKEDDDHYLNRPNYTDKIHCVVFVLSAKAVFYGIPKTTTQKIENVLRDVVRADISRILVLTKADLLCENVKTDASMMCRSVKVHEAVKKASELFSIPIGCIHPVINYEEELLTSPEHNIHLLLALRQVVQNAHDRVNHYRRKSQR